MAGFEGVLATAGWTPTDLKNNIDAFIPTMQGAPQAVLLNIGTNGAEDQTAYTNAVNYVVDACHAAWPNTIVYIAKPWTGSGQARWDSMATWIDAIVVSRPSYTAVGIVENDLLNPTITYTVDGVHPNNLGYSREATSWKAIIHP